VALGLLITTKTVLIRESKAIQGKTIRTNSYLNKNIEFWIKNYVSQINLHKLQYDPNDIDIRLQHFSVSEIVGQIEKK